MRERRLIGAALAFLVSVMAFYGIAGTSTIAGPRLFAITGSHGVHRNDLLITLLWAIGMALCWRLVRRPDDER